MTQHIRDFAALKPDHPAYIMAATGEVVTYKQLNDRSNQGAQLFRSLGLQIGDHIAFMLENHRCFVEICWAAQRAGLYFTAISSRLTTDEAAYIVNDCGARLFISSAHLSETASEILHRSEAVRHYLMVDQPAAGYLSYSELAARQPSVPLEDECEGADMLYSSGTTGRPKGVKPAEVGLPIGSEDRLYEFLAGRYHFSDQTRYLSPAPLYHAAPLRYNMRVQRFGGTCIIMDRFDPETYLRLVGEYRITHGQLVPTMFVRLLKLPEEVRESYDISSFKCAIHAAAPCPVSVKKQMMAWWGPIIHEYYGGTEGNGLCAISPEEWLAHEGSVGQAIIGKLHIMDDDDNALSVGETGTVYFADGKEFIYHNDPEKTARSRNANGWTTLGDVGYVDADGFLYLTDRKSYMIISGGVNIYPQEIEDLLISHPDIEDAAVFGIPNDDFGEEVKAVVQLVKTGINRGDIERQLMAFCRQNLSRIKCPKSIDFTTELPRHPTGKLYKRLLKDPYWQKNP